MKKIRWGLGLLIWIHATNLQAESFVIRRCGTYEFDAYYTEGPSLLDGNRVRPVLLANESTRSEFRLILTQATPELPKNRMKTRMRIQAQIRRACAYDCHVEVLRRVRSLDPFESSQVFSPQKPIAGTEVPCER